ncbi:hypothetical protein BNJ_00142 [Kaumoebavirus]|uniref:hypothetical protein n=1 Tax=Kaumoebavirus TaxID=1859492 RepID=UPI0009C3A917|nr:hypothetical protein BNJ_00142 [Kaumoebavirus]ARA71974.1 hypothetical protein BNJ_00142 [Kaumoebavirus]
MDKLPRELIELITLADDDETYYSFFALMRTCKRFYDILCPHVEEHLDYYSEFTASTDRIFADNPEDNYVALGMTEVLYANVLPNGAYHGIVIAEYHTLEEFSTDTLHTLFRIDLYKDGYYVGSAYDRTFYQEDGFRCRYLDINKKSDLYEENINFSDYREPDEDEDPEFIVLHKKMSSKLRRN